MAAKRFGLYSAFRACSAIFFKSRGTPGKNTYENFVNVFKEGKIKTELGEKKYDKDSEKTVIGEALKKRAELIKSYKKEGSNINPLVLIQLPDRKGQREDELKDKVIKILKDRHKKINESV